MSKGFTLIEIVLVIGLVSFVASASAAYALPSLGKFACAQEAETAKLALERARFFAQFAGWGNIALDIEAGEYLVRRVTGSPGQTLDQFVRQVQIPAWSKHHIVFIENSGGIGREYIELIIGGTDSMCHEVIRINHAGAIL